MRVTFVLPCLDLSGGNRVLSVYARLLHEAGHTVTVIVPVPRQSRQGLRRRLAAYLRPAGPVAAADSRSHFDGLGVPMRHLTHQGPVTDADVPDADLVVATWWETAEWVADLSLSKGAKAYLVQHHEIFDVEHAERVRSTYKLPLHKITVAPWLTTLMRETYGEDEVDTVANAFDPAQFWAPARERQVRPTFGFMYSGTPFKGLEVAVEATRQVVQSLPDVRVVSFGRERPAQLAFLGDRLEFRLDPSQEDIRAAYAGCDVWLMSSHSEGFGLPALEAMACRTPLVSTRTGWPADAVVDGRNGYLANVGDAAGLAHGLLQVLRAAPADWQRLSAAAAQTAAERTWDRAFPEFLAALERARERQNEVVA